ncbi:YtpI family protein [Neobacillus terrae]|uniref:YtpI family protein n=1 Tax=Neobacillus terrae TaxID=3034837 RepID=UPI0014096AF8|nr:YtpI family protein [Neobacillus terrae]NHM30585.1 hypothetical protein [Neobacillus terrae]
MPVLVFFIILSFVFYLFYKIKFVRSHRPVEKKWLSAKSSIALGLFVTLFGLNQIYLYQTALTFIIAAVFVIMGCLSIWNGVKAYKFYQPHAIEEAKNLK